MAARGSHAYYEYIGANVRRIRVRLGLTQDELAGRARLEQRFVQRVERAKVDLRLSTLLKLARALGVAPGALLRKAKLPPARPGRPAGKKSPS